MRPLEWVDPVTVGDAVHALGAGAMAKAGGVDVMDLLKEQLVSPKRLVNLRSIKGLDGLSDGEQGLRVGPLTTLARIAEDRDVRQRYRALAEAAGHTATPQIRNMATLGGNLLQRPRCWYFRSASFQCLKKGGDRCFALGGENAFHAVLGNGVCAIVHPSTTAVALTALGAKVRLTGPGGDREVPLESFFVAPEKDVRRENVLDQGEVITEIVVPPPRAGTRSAYIKQGQKESFDWPLAEVAVLLELEVPDEVRSRGFEGGVCKRASIVLGAAAPVPWRARAAEAALTGRVVDDAAATAAARAALTGAKPLSQNAYKLPLFEAVVRRTILAANRSAS